MKTTLFLMLSLFVLVNLQAQDSLRLVWWQPKDEWVRTKYNEYMWYNEAQCAVIDSTAFYNFKNALVHWWDRYFEECYNDSTPVIYDHYLYGNDTIFFHLRSDWGFYSGFIPGYIGTWIIYEHKEPTFEDFMNWLKTK